MPKRYKVLVTGSSGMLGIDLCKEIMPDYEVIGLDLANNPKCEVRRFINGDITDKKTIAKLINKVHPDIVVHCAAWTDVDGCERDKRSAYKVNSMGADNVALACKSVGALLIYMSTDFVFAGRKETAYKETDGTGPLSVYGDSKLKGENFVRRRLDRYYILRTSWLYGRHGKNFVDTVINKAKTESLIRVVRDQVGSPTYTVYLSKAIHALLDKIICLGLSGYGTYHVSNAGSVSWYNYAREILRFLRSGTKITPITSAELSRPAKRPAMSVMDNSKFAEFTGYRMPGWRIALREYLSGRDVIC